MLTHGNLIKELQTQRILSPNQNLQLIIESLDSISRDERGFPLTQTLQMAEYLGLGTLTRI